MLCLELAALRRDLRWSQEEMAAELSKRTGFVITQKRVSEYERGMAMPAGVRAAYDAIKVEAVAQLLSKGPEIRHRAARRPRSA